MVAFFCLIFGIIFNIWRQFVRIMIFRHDAVAFVKHSISVIACHWVCTTVLTWLPAYAAASLDVIVTFWLTCCLTFTRIHQKSVYLSKIHALVRTQMFFGNNSFSASLKHLCICETFISLIIWFPIYTFPIAPYITTHNTCSDMVTTGNGDIRSIRSFGFLHCSYAVPDSFFESVLTRFEFLHSLTGCGKRFPSVLQKLHICL